jgi:hypothetical protein
MNLIELLSEDVVKKLERGLVKLPSHSYDSIDKLMQKLSKEYGITGKKLHDMFVDKHDLTPDTWIKKKVDENFADGKNPGRKGLAKRSGVNTKASVSSLRKTAKNSSGEKARMAHWLANMKAGKKKHSD